MDNFTFKVGAWCREEQDPSVQKKLIAQLAHLCPDETSGLLHMSCFARTKLLQCASNSQTTNPGALKSKT
eukprot:3926344-Amphidinium_carterae.1